MARKMYFYLPLLHVIYVYYLIPILDKRKTRVTFILLSLSLFQKLFVKRFDYYFTNNKQATGL